jgi:hypothetical protein
MCPSTRATTPEEDRVRLRGVFIFKIGTETNGTPDAIGPGPRQFWEAGPGEREFP